MKKRLLSLIIAVLMIMSITSQLIVPVSFADDESGHSVFIEGADTPMAQFAADEIAAALAKKEISLSDSGAEWIICFLPVNEALGEQCYEIRVSDNQIEIAGGDASGLMYGGLEVAEQIALYGLEGVNVCKGSPYVLHRGYMYNVPMDMRSPAYNSPGDSGQKNIENMWDIDFWKELFDDMARNRFNVLLFENINPYPSMVKVEGFEEVALDDVWRTTIPYDNSARGDCTNIVQQQNWENYEILKTITIEDKIAFWREVMSCAKNRGIEFHLKHSNIYPYVEEGHYGITADKDNEVTREYFYKSAKALLQTYPDLKGLFLTPGENMGWSNESDDKANNIQWLHDVFGKAVDEVLTEDPEREFYFAINAGGSERFAGILGDLKANVLYTAQYAATHMYATAEPHTADPTLAVQPEGSRYWLAFRNEDNFDMRWGDPDFMRTFIGGLPAPDVMYGFITGSDGYCYGRDYSSTDPEVQGQLFTKKHWLNFFLIGRMAYQPDLSEKRIQDVFKLHYAENANSSILYEATKEAGKIIPQVNKIYYQSNGDYTWYVAGCWSHPNAAGFIDLKKWMKGDNTYPDFTSMSVEEYALHLATGEDLPDDGRQTPVEAAENLRNLAEGVLEKVAALPEDENETFEQREFIRLMQDDKAMAYLGLFYSERILAAVDIRLFNETENEDYRSSSIQHLKESASCFDKYVALINENYVPQQLSRVGYYNVMEIAEEVHADIKIAEKWKPRAIRASYSAPDKEDYMRGE